MHRWLEQVYPFIDRSEFTKGFEMTDFLQACKFAEGDSRILMQKMARDRYFTFFF